MPVCVHAKSRQSHSLLPPNQQGGAPVVVDPAAVLLHVPHLAPLRHCGRPVVTVLRPTARRTAMHGGLPSGSPRAAPLETSLHPLPTSRKLTWSSTLSSSVRTEPSAEASLQGRRRGRRCERLELRSTSCLAGAPYGSSPIRHATLPPVLHDCGLVPGHLVGHRLRRLQQRCRRLGGAAALRAGRRRAAPAWLAALGDCRDRCHRSMQRSGTGGRCGARGLTCTALREARRPPGCGLQTRDHGCERWRPVVARARREEAGLSCQEGCGGSGRLCACC